MPPDDPVELDGSNTADDPGATHALLTQLKREWSAEGAAERAQCFGSAIDALKRHLPITANSPTPVNVLVPGAGLGRLNWELSLAGYTSLGIERAMTMWMVEEFVMKALLPSGKSLPVCPFAHEYSAGPTNVRQASHLSRQVMVPDPEALSQAADRAAVALSSSASATSAASAASATSASSAPPIAPSRVIPGDFTQFCMLPDESAKWEAVISCFYIDASGT